MILKSIAIMLVDGNRAKAYLQGMLKRGLVPSFAIYITKKPVKAKKYKKVSNPSRYFDAEEPLIITLKDNHIPYELIAAEDCNDSMVISAVKSRKEKYFIYTGGGILKEEILSTKKKFIHVHPGIVPEYRGSTCMYYSIINEGYCGATAFFMEKSLDTGPVIGQKKFYPIIADIDNIFDPWMRSSLLVEILGEYAETGKFRQKRQKKAGNNYYIIHPVLKHLAILIAEKQIKKNVKRLNQ